MVLLIPLSFSVIMNLTFIHSLPNNYFYYILSVSQFQTIRKFHVQLPLLSPIYIANTVTVNNIPNPIQVRCIVTCLCKNKQIGH